MAFGTEFQEPFVLGFDVFDAPIDGHSLADSCIRVTGEFIPADVEPDLERLLEVGAEAEDFSVEGSGFGEIRRGVGGVAEA